MVVFIAVAAGAVVAVVVGIVVSKYLVKYLISSELPNFTRSSSEQVLLMAKEQLAAQKQDIKTDLDNKKQVIESLVKEIKNELEKTDERLNGAEKERVGSFRELKSELENQRKMTQELSATAESLKKVLSNNQLRGQFGEQVAENLLSMAGFVRGVDFEFNKEQHDTGKRPDFTIFLPNKAKINIDAKFPYQNLQRMTETQDATGKKELLKAFERDIREKIRQVTTRDYINPEDNTVDFVIMFIPNEMIFSFIYDKMNEVWGDAMKQKVVLAGPFSFTAILRMVRQAYDNFKYQNNVQKIIGHIKAFEVEFRKYNEEFAKIGDRIQSLAKQYNEVSSTRTNQLIKSVEKIKLEEPNTQTKLLD